MSITDELQKLAELRQQGLLTEQEFTAAKRKLIATEDRKGGRPTDIQEDDEAGDAASAVEEQTYLSSRWSSGNLFFPDMLILASDGILFRKRSLFGSKEERISYKAIASIRVKNGMFLSTLSIETSGGSQPIFINGLWKSEARAVQETIRAFQRGK
jgi:hypothetical protein